ncbi:type II toxin-antitoxin system RelE/ParE family toxin [bacterium]|nr:type II toxin-antitoxin system RelE/ParE family toxin [bacterium]
MPETNVVLFAEADGTCPLLQLLDGLPSKVQDKCIVRVERLAEMGHELRRPEADFLKDGIYELRASHHGIHYRILYFFYGGTAVISHGLVKEKAVPSREIELAISRKAIYADDPEKHTYRE